MAWLIAWRTRLSENGLNSGFMPMWRVNTSATSMMPPFSAASSR